MILSFIAHFLIFLQSEQTMEQSNAILHQSNKSFEKSEIGLQKTHATSKMICRICHQVQDIDSPLISMCNCQKKAHQGVHKQCMQSYLKSKIEKLVIIQQDWSQILKCQQCQDSYKISYRLSLKCLNQKELKMAVHRKSFLFTTCLIGLLLAIGLLAYTASSLSKKSTNDFNSSSPQTENIVLVSGLILASVLILIFTYKLLSGFVFGKKVMITI